MILPGRVGRRVLLGVTVLAVVAGGGLYLGQRDGARAQFVSVTAAQTPAPSGAVPAPVPSAAPSAAKPDPGRAGPTRSRAAGAAEEEAHHHALPDPAAAVTGGAPPAVAPATCGDWRRLGGKARAEHAKVLLRSAYGDDAEPPAETVRAFQSAVTKRCRAADGADLLADVAWLLYTADPGTWAP